MTPKCVRRCSKIERNSVPPDIRTVIPRNSCFSTGNLLCCPQLACDPNMNFDSNISKISTCSIKKVRNINYTGGRMIVAHKRIGSCFVLKILVHELPGFHNGYHPDYSPEVGIGYTHGELYMLTLRLPD